MVTCVCACDENSLLTVSHICDWRSLFKWGVACLLLKMDTWANAVTWFTTTFGSCDFSDTDSVFNYEKEPQKIPQKITNKDPQHHRDGLVRLKLIEIVQATVNGDDTNQKIRLLRTIKHANSGFLSLFDPTMTRQQRQQHIIPESWSHRYDKLWYSPQTLKKDIESLLIFDHHMRIILQNEEELQLLCLYMLWSHADVLEVNAGRRRTHSKTDQVPSTPTKSKQANSPMEKEPEKDAENKVEKEFDKKWTTRKSTHHDLRSSSSGSGQHMKLKRPPTTGSPTPVTHTGPWFITYRCYVIPTETPTIRIILDLRFIDQNDLINKNDTVCIDNNDIHTLDHVLLRATDHLATTLVNRDSHRFNVMELQRVTTATGSKMVTNSFTDVKGIICITQRCTPNEDTLALSDDDNEYVDHVTRSPIAPHSPELLTLHRFMKYSRLQAHLVANALYRQKNTKELYSMSLQSLTRSNPSHKLSLLLDDKVSIDCSSSTVECCSFIFVYTNISSYLPYDNSPSSKTSVRNIWQSRDNDLQINQNFHILIVSDTDL